MFLMHIIYILLTFSFSSQSIENPMCYSLKNPPIYMDDIPLEYRVYSRLDSLWNRQFTIDGISMARIDINDDGIVHNVRIYRSLCTMCDRMVIQSWMKIDGWQTSDGSEITPCSMYVEVHFDTAMEVSRYWPEHIQRD